MGAENDVVIPEWIHFTKEWHHSQYPAISPTRPELSASGKNVVITGGGSGIGKSIAKSFAQAGAASVTIIGRTEDRLKSSVAEISAASSKETQISYEVADLTKRSEVDKAFESISKKVGKLSILVSNAGFSPVKPVLEMEPDWFMDSFAKLVLTDLNAAQAFLSKSIPDATIINISSGIAHIAPMPGMATYALSKSAGTKFFNYLAAENPKLHVFNLQPGVISTETNEGTSMKGQDDINLPGGFCVWLASPEATFLNNKFVWANWDVDELKARAAEIKDSMLCEIILNGMPQ